MTILSTKKLKPNQRELLLNAGVSFVEYNAIDIKCTPFELPDDIKNVIITSQNGARAFIKKIAQSDIVENCFAVGEKTSALLVQNDVKVIKTAQNASKLADFIIKNYRSDQFTYFCGKQRRDELVDTLEDAGVICKEVVVYETHLNEQSFDQKFDGILFFSPSGVSAFAKANTSKSIVFCIGETTASEARKHFETVVVSNATTIESTIAKAVKTLK